MARSLVSVVAVLTLTTVACADEGDGDGTGGDGAMVEGVTWVLQRSSVDELAPGAPDDARIDVVFEDDGVSGVAACNRYFGPYEVDGGALSFGNLGSTGMACEPPLMELETAYFGALGAVREYEVSAEELVLTGEGVRLVFDAEAPPEPEALVGTTWGLDAIALGTDAVASPIAGTEVTLEFREDGSAGGSGGCNTFRAGYETDGASIAFEPVASTRMACEPDVMEQEAAVFGALEAAATFEIEGDVLTLRDADDGFLVSFRASA